MATKLSKRIVAIFLCLMMLCGNFMVTGSAADVEYTSGNYTYTVSSGKTTITAYKETATGNVEIPEKLGGYPVVKIDEYAFFGCTLIESVVIPTSVKEIGKYAFAYCTTLSSVTIPSSVTSIGEKAFNNSKKVVIKCEEGSYAYNYSKEQGYSIELLNDVEAPDGTTISFSEDEYTYSVGEEFPLSGEIYSPKGTAGITLEWSVSDNSGISISTPASMLNTDANHIIFSVLATGKKEGEYTVTVKTSNGASVSTKVIAAKHEDERLKFVNEHIVYYNNYRNLWFENGFSINTDSDKLKKNATASRVWDSIKDLGEVATFKFDKLQISADYYDVYISDMMLAFSEKSAADEVKFKAGEYYSSGFEKISTFLESSKDYNILSDSFKIESAFDKDYDISDSMKENFSVVFKDAYKNHPDLFRDIYQGFDCADEICKDISTGIDAYNTFRDCYQAYCISKATKEVCSEFFDFCYDVANELNISYPKFANWFNKNINKFKNNAKSDSDLYLATKTAWKAGYIVYDTFIKDLVKDTTYNIVAKTLGVGVSKLLGVVAAWNIGTALGDLIAGNDTESAYYMYYISPIEEAMQKVLTHYGETMKSRKSFVSANKFEIAFTTLKHTNIALYTKTFDFASKHHILWIKTKTMKSNMENATYYKEKWQQFNCHKSEYSISTNSSYKAIGIRCPVDIYLYNSSNKLVLSIVSEKIQIYNDPIIAVDLSNEQKGICYPANQNYRIEIVSRSEGTMDYSVMSAETDSIREIETNNIPLRTKQRFIGNIPQNHNAETNQFELSTNGITIPLDFDSFNTIHDVVINDMIFNYKHIVNLNTMVIVDSGVIYTVKYTSSNPNIATVDDNGNVYGAGKGTATITCTVTDEAGNSVSDTCKVTVNYAWWQWIIKIVLFGWIWY